MTDRSNLSLDRRAAAIALAAVAGTMIDVALWILRTALVGPAVTDLGGLLAAVIFLLVCTFVGSLVAVPLGLLVGLPLWHVAERADRRSRRDALRFGLAAGAIIGSIMAVLSGPPSILDAPRLPGVWHELLKFADYCIAGTFAGVVAHRFAFGHGQNQTRLRPRSPAIDSQTP